MKRYREMSTMEMSEYLELELKIEALKKEKLAQAKARIDNWYYKKRLQLLKAHAFRKEQLKFDVNK